MVSSSLALELEFGNAPLVRALERRLPSERALCVATRELPVAAVQACAADTQAQGRGARTQPSPSVRASASWAKLTLALTWPRRVSSAERDADCLPGSGGLSRARHANSFASELPLQRSSTGAANESGRRQ